MAAVDLIDRPRSARERRPLRFAPTGAQVPVACWPRWVWQGLRAKHWTKPRTPVGNRYPRTGPCMLAVTTLRMLDQLREEVVLQARRGDWTHRSCRASAKEFGVLSQKASASPITRRAVAPLLALTTSIRPAASPDPVQASGLDGAGETASFKIGFPPCSPPGRPQSLLSVTKADHRETDDFFHADIRPGGGGRITGLRSTGGGGGTSRRSGRRSAAVAPAGTRNDSVPARPGDVEADDLAGEVDDRVRRDLAESRTMSCADDGGEVGPAVARGAPYLVLLGDPRQKSPNGCRERCLMETGVPRRRIARAMTSPGWWRRISRTRLSRSPDHYFADLLDDVHCRGRPPPRPLRWPKTSSISAGPGPI